ncbi:tyrosine tRNA ligase [Tilletiopsis washingtonensis]|uniref:Tyrosine--tRNA ligase n=1 Tax=Tilletiopsis washingtonensis TaxID=58919 RepID=A0A316ZCQ9_9BASI|nr:tyrosine tRNA ligase [Tilletiopsis washingtonensis]PWN99321.1 tyrosine tRNA ligase [Tilletiopsis washingtonensis]
MSAPPKLAPAEAYELITRDLHEVLGAEPLRALLDKQERPVRAYWGTAPTGRPHVGYLVPLAKIADFLTAGVEVKVLLADVHAFLDNLKAPIELVRHRVVYYRMLLTTVLQSIGVPVERLTFVVGSSFQLSAAYNMDAYRLAASTTEHDAKKAGAEVVKQVSSPLLSGLLYPGLQALDEQYLDVDFQFGGVDQRKIFTFAEAVLPKLGYAKRSHLMNPMVPGLKGSKMSSSDAGSKIDFLDEPSAIRKKIKDAACVEGVVEDNGVLAFTKAVLLPLARLRFESGASGAAGVHASAPPGTLFSIMRDDKFGGPAHYKEYSALEADFASKALHPGDLKKGVADAICQLLEPVQREFEQNEEFRKAEADAYPKEPEPVKKKKEKKSELPARPKAGTSRAQVRGRHGPRARRLRRGGTDGGRCARRGRRAVGRRGGRGAEAVRIQKDAPAIA